MRAGWVAALGAVITGLFASACCLVPMALALLGLSSGALALGLEPLRPFLLVGAYGLLGGAFYLTYRKGPDSCAPQDACSDRTTTSRPRALLWLAALAALLAKEPPGKRPVCYCFGIGEEEIRAELAETGASTAVERISALVRAGRCACEIKNPQGSCCLGNVARVVQAAARKVS